MQSETSELSTLISGAQVTQLATNGRNVTALAALGLGVSNNSAGVQRGECPYFSEWHQLQRDALRRTISTCWMEVN